MKDMSREAMSKWKGIKDKLYGAAKKWNRNHTIFAICIVLMALLLLIPGQYTSTERLKLSDSSSIRDICELATLRCFYHDVGEFEYQLEGVTKTISDIALWPLNEWIRPGYKRLWMEYDGIIEYGIDTRTDIIQINDPDEHGVVDVYLPDAKVLNVEADDDSFLMYEDTGFLVSISGEEQTKVFAETQKKMKENAKQDQALLRRAKYNAKQILEEYIIKVGKGLGADYKVNWIDAPR